MSRLPIHRINMPKVTRTLDRGFGKVAVEIVRPWGGYQVGTVIKPPGIVRGWLIDTGRAVLYKGKPPVEKPASRPRQKKAAAVKSPEKDVD